MKIKEPIFHLFRYVLVIVFFYMGLTKLLEGKAFYNNLYNSPLLDEQEILVSVLAWLIPGIELLIAISLVFGKYLKFALMTGLLVLGFYTVYIAAILWWAPSPVCTCGGFSSILNWEQQLMVSLGLILLSLLCLYLLSARTKLKNDYRGEKRKK